MFFTRGILLLTVISFVIKYENKKTVTCFIADGEYYVISSQSISKEKKNDRRKRNRMSERDRRGVRKCGFRKLEARVARGRCDAYTVGRLRGLRFPVKRLICMYATHLHEQSGRVRRAHIAAHANGRKGNL